MKKKRIAQGWSLHQAPTQLPILPNIQNTKSLPMSLSLSFMSLISFRSFSLSLSLSFMSLSSCWSWSCPLSDEKGHMCPQQLCGAPINPTHQNLHVMKPNHPDHKEAYWLLVFCTIDTNKSCKFGTRTRTYSTLWCILVKIK